MTRERAKELLPFMTAWANGEAVQWRWNPATETMADGKWRDYDDYQLELKLESAQLQVRIKPKLLEVWILEWNDGERLLCKSQHEAESVGKGGSCGYKRIVRLREVEEVPSE